MKFLSNPMESLMKPRCLSTTSLDDPREGPSLYLLSKCAESDRGKKPKSARLVERRGFVVSSDFDHCFVIR